MPKNKKNKKQKALVLAKGSNINNVKIIDSIEPKSIESKTIESESIESKTIESETIETESIESKIVEQVQSKSGNTFEVVPYTTEYLLDRAYESFSMEKKKMNITPPEFERKDRKSYIKNFAKLCQSLGREPEEIRLYIGKELQMDTSIKDGGILKIDGLVQRVGEIEKIIEEFVKNNMMCKSCNSCKTKTQKVGRLTYMICEVCKSKLAIKNDNQKR